jgi:hypothetical protein
MRNVCFIYGQFNDDAGNATVTECVMDSECRMWNKAVVAYCL